jgi:hypothetical protein
VIVLIGFLVAGGVVCLVGAAEKERRKPLHKRGVFVNGTAALAKGARVVWRKPGLVLDRVAVSYLAGGLVVVTVVLATRPDQIWKVVAVVVAALLVGAVAWDHKVTGGRPWGEVLARISREEAGRAALATTHPDAKAGTVKVRGDRLEIPVAHVGPIDAERVGQALHAPHVELVPGSELGRSTVVVHGSAPALDLPLWEAIAARGPMIWPGTVNATGRVRFGEDVHGNVHVLPQIVNPDSPGNVLIAGATGSGKSNGLALVMCELAWQEHIAWVGLDPHRVEMKPFTPRMSRVAKGPDECYETLDWLVAEMDERFKYIDRNDLGEWRIGVDGPGVLWIADELAGLDPKRSWAQFARLTAEQRKVGFGCIMATQRPERNVIELKTRDNLQIRCAFGMNSRFGTEMVLDDDEDKTYRPTQIPEDLQGGYVLRLRRRRLAGRCYIPTATGRFSKADVQDTCSRVAAATAHLRVELKGTP